MARLNSLKRGLQQLPAMVSAIPTMSEQRMAGRALQARRLKLWTKADGKCQGCGKVVAYPHGFELDHKQALVNGGEDSEANCQVLCIEPDGGGCHAAKTAQDMTQAHLPTRQTLPRGKS